MIPTPWANTRCLPGNRGIKLSKSKIKDIQHCSSNGELQMRKSSANCVVLNVWWFCHKHSESKEAIMRLFNDWNEEFNQCVWY